MHFGANIKLSYLMILLLGGSLPRMKTNNIDTNTRSDFITSLEDYKSTHRYKLSVEEHRGDIL